MQAARRNGAVLVGNKVSRAALRKLDRRIKSARRR